MIKQGERILFQGTFQEKIGDEWEFRDIKDYSIRARISNPTNRKTFNFSSLAEGDFSISISEDFMSYSFSIYPKYTSQMIGECYCEIALVDTDSNPIIANEAIFIVEESTLGRELANE